MQKLTRRTYAETFRAEAVTLAQSSNEGGAAVAASLGVDVTTLRTWLHRAHVPSSDFEAHTPSEKKELAQLQREISVLKMKHHRAISFRKLIYSAISPSGLLLWEEKWRRWSVRGRVAPRASRSCMYYRRPARTAFATFRPPLRSGKVLPVLLLPLIRPQPLQLNTHRCSVLQIA
jgi:transposase-like protein